MQVAFVVLVGLASKNAILIVEFARDREHEGASRFDAAVEAAKVRLRPILMTSFAFVLGVFPLVIAHGAGAEMRRTLGTAVFAGNAVSVHSFWHLPDAHDGQRWVHPRGSTQLCYGPRPGRAGNQIPKAKIIEELCRVPLRLPRKDTGPGNGARR